MKKLYDELEMEVIRFNAEDVIVTSGEEQQEHCAGITNYDDSAFDSPTMK